MMLFAIWLTGFVVFGWAAWLDDNFDYAVIEDRRIVLVCSVLWPLFLFYATITGDRRPRNKGRN